MLTAPGHYRLQVRLPYDAYRQQLVSNVVALTVVSPDSVQQPALAAMQAHALQSRLTPEARYVPADAATLQALRDFISAYPRSAYAPYARLGLAALCAAHPDAPACRAPLP